MDDSGKESNTSNKHKTITSIFSLPLLLTVITITSLIIGILIGTQFNSSPKTNNQKETTSRTPTKNLASQKSKVPEKEPTIIPGTCAPGSSSCLVEIPLVNELFGQATIEGYYKQVEQTGWGGTATCDVLAITGGTEEYIEHYQNKVEGGNTINSIDENGVLEYNLDLSNVSEDVTNKIKESTKRNPITLNVFDPRSLGTHAPACHSFGVIVELYP